MINADVVVRRFDAKVQDDLLRSSLTPEERHALTTVEGPLKKSKRLDNVLRMQRPKILTKASLIDGDASFDEMLLKTGQSPAPIGKTP